MITKLNKNEVVKKAIELLTNANRTIYLTHAEEEAPPNEAVKAYREKYAQGVKVVRVLFDTQDASMEKIVNEDIDLGIEIYKATHNQYTQMLIIDEKEGLFSVPSQSKDVFYVTDDDTLENLLKDYKTHIKTCAPKDYYKGYL